MDTATAAARQLSANMNDEELDCAIRALASGALLYHHPSGWYAARYDGYGWWMWRLSHSSQEHYVLANYSHCTCDSQESPCKHIKMLKFGV